LKGQRIEENNKGEDEVVDSDDESMSDVIP